MIHAVIADDSAFLRQVLKDVLESSRRITVVGSAKNGKEAIEYVRSLKPDILILDCEMPVMNGLEALRRIMTECPLPVFIFSSLASEGSSVTIRALEYGAVDFFLKPTRGAHELSSIADDLIRKIEFIVSKSRFVNFAAGQRPVAVAKGGSLDSLSSRKIDIVAMGSSTGGVQAAMNVVPLLPKETKPVVWVQHMPPYFTKSFAERLNAVSRMEVKEAQNGDILRTGCCYLAPGGFQMKIRKGSPHMQLVVDGQEKVSGHCPSCNVLFDSVAEFYSNNAIGVILTGMGEDGKDGLVKMHNNGAYVIGQNEESCVVYGMPRAAHLAGAVDAEFDIHRIAHAIMRVGGFQDSGK